MNLISIINSDLRRVAGSRTLYLWTYLRYYIFNGSFRVMLTYRLGHYCLYSTNIILHHVIYPIIYLFHWHNQLRMGINLSFKTQIGDGLMFAHTGGIVVNSRCKIGRNVTIYQNVTIGDQRGKHGNCFEIGDNTVIFAGAAIIGPLRIGSNVAIGANSLIIKDVEDGLVMGGVPGKVINTDSTSALKYY